MARSVKGLPVIPYLTFAGCSSVSGNSYALMLANLLRGPYNFHYAMSGCIGATVANAIANDAGAEREKQTTIFTPPQAGMLQNKVRSLDLFNDPQVGSPLRKALSVVHPGSI